MALHGVVAESFGYGLRVGRLAVLVAAAGDAAGHHVAAAADAVDRLELHPGRADPHLGQAARQGEVVLATVANFVDVAEVPRISVEVHDAAELVHLLGHQRVDAGHVPQNRLGVGGRRGSGGRRGCVVEHTPWRVEGQDLEEVHRAEEPGDAQGSDQPLPVLHDQVVDPIGEAREDGDEHRDDQDDAQSVRVGDPGPDPHERGGHVARDEASDGHADEAEERRHGGENQQSS